MKNLIPGPILAPKFFFVSLLLLLVRYCSKLSPYAIYRKTNEPNMRKWQKTDFRSDFGLFDSKSAPKIIFVSFTSTRC